MTFDRTRCLLGRIALQCILDGAGDGMGRARATTRVDISWTFAGRIAEHRVIESARRDMACGGMLLVGSTGTGKSALAMDAMRRTAGQEADRGWVAGSSATAGTPFGVLSHLAETDVPVPSDDFALLRWAHDTLKNVAGSTGGLLVADDAHLLDPQSASVVARLVIDPEVFPIITAPDTDQLPVSIAKTARTGRLRTIELGPLPRPDVERLVGAVLGGRLSTALRHDLWRMSQGNAMVLRAIVDAAARAGHLRTIHGVWQTTRRLERLPQLRKLLPKILGPTDEAERYALDVLAVTAPLDVVTLQRVAGVDIVEGLEGRQLVTVHASGRRFVASWRHPAAAAIAAATMPTLRLRRIFRDLAEAEPQPPTRRASDEARAADWRTRAGVEVAADSFGRAIRSTGAAGDHARVERLARVATAGGGDFDAHLALVQSLMVQGRLHDAWDVARTVPAAASSVPEWERSLALQAEILIGRHDPDVRLILEQLPAADGHESTHGDVEAIQIVSSLLAGSLSPALECARDFLAASNASTHARLMVTIPYVRACATVGRHQQALAAVGSGLQLATETPSSWPLAEDLLLSAQAAALRQAGELRPAERLARARHDQAVASRRPYVQALWAVELADVLAMRGHAQPAWDIHAEALHMLRDEDAVGVHAHVLTQAAYVAALLGQPDRVAELLALHESASSQATAPLLGARPERASAWVDYLDGDIQGAVGQAHAAGAAALGAGRLVDAALLFHDAVRFGYPDQAAAHLAHLASRTDGILTPLLRDHAQALAAQDGVRLDAVADSLKSIGADLYAAEAAAQAALLHQRNADAGQQRRSLAAAGGLADRCTGVSTPWRWQTVPKDLTLRELEIAHLAAGGQTNQQIGRTLGISPRTVGNHLASVYGKMGVSGRLELASALEPNQHASPHAIPADVD
jgi:DNA-binding CsgD family transcriptional regulator/1,2-phenylacetyl-CoA epoxidase PaaB subunit